MVVSYIALESYVTVAMEYDMIQLRDRVFPPTAGEMILLEGRERKKQAVTFFCVPSLQGARPSTSNTHKGQGVVSCAHGDFQPLLGSRGLAKPIERTYFLQKTSSPTRAVHS